MWAKTSVPLPRHYASCANSPCRQKLRYVPTMSASCRVADTSYQSMQAPVQYILFLSNLYVHTYLTMKKGTFSFNQCMYICTCMYCLLEVYRSSASGSASADIRMNFDIRIRIRNISCGCHADIANNKRIIF